MTEDLPLFPLGTVLFPGLVLPLHVFEKRYRALVKTLLERPEGGARRFGVVAIRQGREVGVEGRLALYDVGCTAELRRVEPYADGRFDLVTSGVTRFRLAGIDNRLPYLVGRVDYLPDDVGDPATAELLAVSVREAFDGYLRALSAAQGDTLEPPVLPSDPLLLSYLVAATIVVDLGDRQRLLAEPHAAARLRTELRLLRRETTVLGVFSAAPAPEFTRAPFSLN